MKRRQALKQLGFGLSSTLVGGSYLMSCKKDDPLPEIQYDGSVVIIGAGVAGLYAADILHAKGLNVTVLEATKQLGGRIRSLKNQQGLQSIADFPVELGAEYFQGGDSIFGKMISNMKLETVDLGGASNRFIMDGTAKDEAGWATDADFIASQNFVDGIKGYTGAPRSVAAAAQDIGQRAQQLLNSQVGDFYGSVNERLGMRGLSDQMKLVQHSEEYRLLKHNSLQDLVISRFSNIIDKVEFETPVKSINYGGTVVSITLEDGRTVEANKVVVTVPLPILKTGISFTPALPEAKRNAINRIGMDPCMRVILDFKKNFWGEDAGFVWGAFNAPQMLNAGFGRSQFYRTMSITICGPKALELSAKPTGKDIVNAILAELDEIYDGAGTLFIRKELLTGGGEGDMIYFIQDWTKEKYFEGGYSYPTVITTIDDRTALGAPVGTNLFFAGEATDIHGDPGTINGAMASAERAAEELVKSILEVS